MSIAFTYIVIVLAVVSIAAGLWALRNWSGKWRVLALASLLPIVIVAANIVVDVASDPTSHNLWPFEVLMAGVASLILRGCIEIGRRIVGRFA